MDDRQRVFLGIDPGINGGIAVVDADGTVIAVTRMPETEADVLTFLGAYSPVKPGIVPRALLERVSAAPGMGVVSAFTFGKGIGALRMALLAESIPFDEVTPKKWQTAMGALAPKDERGKLGKKDKNISKRRAQALFPRHHITHANADSLLLAEYARRRELGLGEFVDISREEHASLAVKD